MPWLYISQFLKAYQCQLKEHMNRMAMVAAMEVMNELNNVDSFSPNLLMLAA